MSGRRSRVLMFSSSGLVATVPTLLNLIEELQRARMEVTVVSPPADAALPSALDDTTFVDVHPLPRHALARVVMRALGDRMQQHAAEVSSLASAVGRIAPDLVVAVDGPACIATTLVVPPRIPIAYQSLELLIARELHGRYWPLVHAFERGVIRRARVVLVQDADRAAILAREAGVDAARMVLVPNAPRGPARRAPGNFWRERFALPADARVALYAGSWASWACLDEIVASVSSWPAEWHLVVHARNRPDDVHALDGKVRAWGLEDRVHVSTRPVSADAAHELFDGADAGLAFYRPGFTHPTDGENLRVLGASAGKVAALAQAGVPIITNDATSLGSLIPSYGAGWAVSSAAGIAGALGEWPAARARMSEGALELYARHFNPEPGLARAVAAIQRAADRAGAEATDEGAGR